MNLLISSSSFLYAKIFEKATDSSSMVVTLSAIQLFDAFSTNREKID
jgi:hypothetical protein